MKVSDPMLHDLTGFLGHVRDLAREVAILRSIPTILHEVEKVLGPATFHRLSYSEWAMRAEPLIREYFRGGGTLGGLLAEGSGEIQKKLRLAARDGVSVEPSGVA